MSSAQESELSRQGGVAVIGAGYWGKNLVRNFAQLGALSAVCDADPATLASSASKYPAASTYSSPEEVLNDPNTAAVAIAAPAAQHAELTKLALLAGKDVFVEKPLALSVETGEKLVALAEAEGRVLMVGHLLWYHPAVVALKELVDTGQLGRIQYVSSNRLNLGRIRVEENILWSFAPHDISLLLGLLDEMPNSVIARGSNLLHDNVTDVTVSLLSFPSGVKAHIYVSWLHPFKEQRFVVIGDRHMAVFSDTAENKLVVYPHSITWEKRVPVPRASDAEVISVDASEPLARECQHFLDCVATRTSPLTDGREGVRVLSVLEACQRSLEQTTAQMVRTGDAV